MRDAAPSWACGLEGWCCKARCCEVEGLSFGDELSLRSPVSTETACVPLHDGKRVHLWATNRATLNHPTQPPVSARITRPLASSSSGDSNNIFIYPYRVCFCRAPLSFFCAVSRRNETTATPPPSWRRNQIVRMSSRPKGNDFLSFAGSVRSEQKSFGLVDKVSLSSQMYVTKPLML